MAFPYLYPICLQSYNEVFYASLIQYVLYLEYSSFCDKLFCRAQYQLSLTDRMDCKSQKGRIRIGNITRNRNDEQHNCLLNNQKYVIDTRLFKCINYPIKNKPILIYIIKEYINLGIIYSYCKFGYCEDNKMEYSESMQLWEIQLTFLFYASI